jgi:lichenan operon transcriptional antiterminator
MYLSSKDAYLTSKDIASVLDISVRTVKTELKIIQEYAQNFTSFRVESLSNRGSRLAISDETLFLEELKRIKKEAQTSGLDAENRAKFVIRFLLDQKDFKSKIQLENEFYLSESTLYNCMKEVKKILSVYNLHLRYKTNYGYKIDGEELDKESALPK